MINNKGVPFRYTFDGLGRMTQKVEDVGGLGTTTTWAYNGLGLVTSMTDDDSHATTYDYDDAGRVTKITYPDTGDVDFAYDDAANEKTRTDQKGVVTTYAYDDLHRLVSRSYSTGGADAFEYDRSGRLTVADNALVEVDFEYDGLGRLETERHTFLGDSEVYEVGHAYDYPGSVPWTETISYPAGRDVVREYDARFRLQEVDGDHGT